MKICPTCRKTYADDNLNFCLEDGSVLTFAASEPPATVLMSQPRPTDPTAAFSSVPNGGVQSTFGQQQMPNYTMQQPKKSKAWLWIVGIVGIILLLCGGGFAGLVLVGMQANQNQSNSTTYPTPSNGRVNSSASPAPSPFSSSTSSDVETVDLSLWVKDFSVWGTTEMSGDEFQMAAKQKGYYYVLVAPDDYTTDNKNVRVTVRNINNASSSLGYGLIFHSATTPLTKGYAFLIDTQRKRFRVVRHEPSNELTLVKWTNSPAVKDGAQDNVLEARDKGETIELYVNDQMVTSIKDQHGTPDGVPGLYSGDGAKIGFKKLEIFK